MNWKATLAFLSVTLLLAAQASAVLVSRYTFDNASISGKTALDVVGSNNAVPTGTNGGTGITTGQSGYFADAFRFAGAGAGAAVTDYENLLAVPAGVSPSGAAERTFTTWFNQLALSGQNKLFGYGDVNTDMDATTGEGFDVGLEAGGVRIRNGNGNITYGTGLNFLGANAGWNHLAVRVNPGATTFANVDIFLNGSLLAPQDPLAIDLADTLATTSSPLGIGNTSNTAGGSATTNGFNGLIDDFRIYNNALSNSEIVTLASAPATPTFAITVNRGTGGILLSHSGATANILGYRLLSTAGALNQTGWTKISTAYDESGDKSVDTDNDWTVLSPATSTTSLAEAELEGGNGGFLANAQSVNFSQSGGLWTRNPTEDIAFELLLADGSIVNASVFYTGNGDAHFQTGDLNFDGAINAADWGVFRSNLFSTYTTTGLANYARGDLDGDGDTDRFDFSAFRTAFDAANGIGAFASVSSAVPEHSSLAGGLALMVAACLFRSKSRREGSSMLFHVGRRCKPLVLLLGAMVATLAASPASAVLIARYSFDDTNIVSGTKAQTDLAGANNAAPTGTNGGANITTGAVGVFGQAYSFLNDNAPGGNATVMLSDFENLMTVASGAVPSGTAERTFSLWFNHSASVGQNKLFGYGTNVGGQALDVGLEAGGIRLRHFGGNITYGAGFDFLGANAGWHHLAVRVNAGASTFANVDVFLNGSALAVTATGGGGTGQAINTAASAFGIGTTSIDTGGAIPNGFTGLLDEFRIYNNALSNSEIAALALPPAPQLLTLEVETNTGRVYIKNASGADFSAGFYQISSDDVASNGGSLVPANWNSLQDQNLAGFPAGNGTGNGWEEGGVATDKILGEAFLGIGGAGASLFADGMTPINLGAIFKTTDAQDLTFTYQLANGTFVNGNVAYVTGPAGLNGDYNNDGHVDAADYTVWRDRLGTSAVLPNDTTPGSVTQADYAVWKSNFGLPALGAVAGNGAVPEPAAALLLTILASVLLGAPHARRHRRAAALGAAALLMGWAATSQAKFDDRIYRFGETEGGAAGNPIVGGVTFDSAGVSMTGTFQDLAASGAATYANVSSTGAGALSRPGAAAGAVGITLDGASFLSGANLNRPSLTASSTAGGGNLDYSGLNNRGFQLWVRPSAVGTLQRVVQDSNQHGVTITAAGLWQMNYGGTSTTSTLAAATNAWSHVELVNPAGNLSVLYVNGVAVATDSRAYADSDFPLVIGANTGVSGTVGTTEFFTGVVDDMSMFVIGTTTNGLQRGPFNFATDNAFAASKLSAIPGDFTGAGGLPDGVVNSLDSNAFLAGWENRNLVNNRLVGDLNSYAKGDLNFDGVTDLRDAFILHTGLQNAGLGGLNFAALGNTAVPEPSALVVAAIFCATLTPRRLRRTLLSA
ncbi:hypothetical protein Pla175_22090 [Pirellulimonas nuda]|uniref:LamG-like jellyroll fold domain-containing protein n=1 Tax=Pirellulimonas nuda TaxID=2528009 RepID=A0A518DBG6_9BACT|nr:LamG domain-containing protein [Pirellulimonas nuda]QDU88825.1 hypothetical protein Pla175_22090 [Pirellulimonas nuda]